MAEEDSEDAGPRGSPRGSLQHGVYEGTRAQPPAHGGSVQKPCYLRKAGLSEQQAPSLLPVTSAAFSWWRAVLQGPLPVLISPAQGSAPNPHTSSLLI